MALLRRGFGSGQQSHGRQNTGIVDEMRLAVAMGMISMGMGQSTTVPTVEGTYFVAGRDAVKWDSPGVGLFSSID